MEKYNYPNVKIHKLEYEKFRKEFAVRNLKIFKSVTFKEGIEFLVSLKEWYTYWVYIKKFNVIMVCYLRSCIDEK